MRGSTWARRTALAIGLAATCAAGPLACSGDDDDDTAAATTTEASTTTEADSTDTGSTDTDPCAARDALRESLEGLADVDIVADGTDGIKEAIDDASAALDDLGDVGRDDLEDEVDAVRTALDNLRDAVESIDDGGGAGTGLSALGDAVTGLTRAVSDLATELENDCD